MTITHEPAAVAIDSILLATDFSGASERAADYARAIARKFNSTLDMVHVVDPSAVAICDEVVSPAATPHGQVCDAPNMERSHASFVESGVTTRAYTAEGHDAAQTLLGIAHNRHSNLIITGTRAKSGVGRLIMGSTAETLIRNSECPVLTIGPKANRPLDGNFDFRTIVYATDFSEQAAKAARYALAFAAHSNGRLCCCFVESDEIEVPAIQAERTARFTRELYQMMPETPAGASTPEFFIEHGEPADAILRLAHRVRADLIVLGPRKSSFWLNYVDRGLTPSLLAEATCPVMTIC